MFDTFIEEVASKYGYSDELVEALKRIIPVMADGKDEEAVQLLKDTLERVPIYVFDKLPSQEDLDKIKIDLNRGRNSHVVYDNESVNSGQEVIPGAYHSWAIFDEHMNIVDRVGYLYVTKLPEYSKTAKFYNTRINLAVLIHELGHAWAAQKGEYEQYEDGSYHVRMGALRAKVIVDRDNCTDKISEQHGLYIEEAINSINEKEALCKLFGIENVEEIPGFVGSNYEKIAYVMKFWLNVCGEITFSNMRIKKDESLMKIIQEYFDKTKFATELIHSPEYYKQKKEKMYCFENTLLKESEKNKIRDFYEQYHNLFFEPQDKEHDIFSYLDNALKQLFTLSASYKYYIDLDSWDKKDDSKEGSLTPDEARMKAERTIMVEECLNPLVEIVNIFNEISQNNLTSGSSKTTLKSVAEQTKKENHDI